MGSCEHLAWSVVAPWDEANADDSLLRSSSPTVVGAFLPDCPSCREASSTLERLAWTFAHVVRFCSLDVARSPELAFQFGIWRTPAIVLVVDGVATRRATKFDEGNVWALLGMSPDSGPMHTEAIHSLPMLPPVLVRPSPVGGSTAAK